MSPRLWSRYREAMEAFTADPTPRNEGIVIARYAEFAREACPDDAAELISLLCRTTAEYVADWRRAA